MAKVELDEVELQRLQKQDATVHRLMSNSNAKKKILQAYKDVDPNARIPELEVEEAARAPVQALEKTVTELRQEFADDKKARDDEKRIAALNGSMESGFAKLRREGWLDDGIENVKKLMEEKGLLNPLDAAKIYLADHPPQSPANPSGSGSWDFMAPPAEDDTYIKTITASKSAADNDQLVMNEARKTVQQFREQNQARR